MISTDDWQGHNNIHETIMIKFRRLNHHCSYDLRSSQTSAQVHEQL